MAETSTIDVFMEDLRYACKKNGISLRLTKGAQVEFQPGVRCSGYFDGANKQLVVATGNDQWLATLVHEFCHLEQFLQGSEFWKKADNFGFVTFDKWLSGKNVKGVLKSINSLITLELDCEKRALKKIIEYDLPVNTVTYIQRANAYILYYRYVYETGRWSNKSIGLIDEMPTRFMSNSYYKRLTDKMRKIFIKQGL
jgi:hypothetical protein